jgi:hypothetical protein
VELTIAIVFWTNVGDSSGAVKQISPLLSLQADQSEFDGVIHCVKLILQDEKPINKRLRTVNPFQALSNS